MVEKVGATISASQIVNLMNPDHPIGNSEAAKQGRIEHYDILHGILEGNIPKQLIRVEMLSPIETPTRSSHREIAPNLWLTVIPDLRCKDKILELKPRANEIRYYMVQLAIGCMVEDRKKGVLFFHHDERVYGLKNGGSIVWENLIKMAGQARRILDIQEIIDKQKPPALERKNLGYEAWSLRKSFDMGTNIVMTGLRSNISSLN